MIKEQLEFFKENGYLVVPNALSAAEVCAINAAIDRDLVENPVMWIDRGQTGRCQNVHALLACPEMDVTMRPPRLLPLMRAIMGTDLCAEEHSVMLRAPNPDGDTECRWHRDANRENTGDAEPPYYTRYLSVVFLPDRCRRHNAHLQRPPRHRAILRTAFPLEAYDLSTAQHLVGPAGTAILFNASTFHAGNVRQTTAERRTIHIYCGRTTDRYLSNHTIFPRRLWEGKDAVTQHYYSRPNPITQLLIERFP